MQTGPVSPQSVKCQKRKGEKEGLVVGKFESYALVLNEVKELMAVWCLNSPKAECGGVYPIVSKFAPY